MRLPDLTAFRRVVFFTGAGMSAESGVPTYRGAGGVWKQYDYHRYACQPAFDRHPDAVWEFHNYRRSLVAACEPNAGHAIIARAEQVLPSVTVVTQNIDGLHQKAGSENVLELHGSLWGVRCDATGERETRFDVPFEGQRADGRWWRPDIVWFGDSLRDAVVSAAIEAIRGCDLLVAVGTSAVVYPAAQLPTLARQAGATMLEINPDETPMSAAYDLCMRGTATEMLGRLAANLPSD